MKNRIRCLILGCGNALRGDDGVGPWLCAWAEERFAGQPGVRVIARQQWTPELADEIAAAESVVFVDSSVESAAGLVRLIEVSPEPGESGWTNHHAGAPQLLALARDLYSSIPAHALLLTIGAGSIALGEEFSAPVRAALAEACQLLAETVLNLSSGTRTDLSDHFE
jgi:hydrogenase maturation protease